METICRSMSVELLVCCIFFHYGEVCRSPDVFESILERMKRIVVLLSSNFPCIYESNLSSNIYELLLEQTFQEVLWSVVSFKVC